MTGCQAAKDVKLAEAFLSDFMDEFDDEDYDDVVDLMHEDLIDDLGGDETAQGLMMWRRKLAGEIDEYSIKETSFEHASGMTQVTFALETSYDRESELEEEFIVLVDGDDISLVAIDLEALSIFDDIMDDFFTAYQTVDTDGILRLFCPIYFDYSTRDDMENNLTFVRDTAGAFESWELIDQTMLMEEVDGKALALAEVKLRITHNNMDIIARIQIAEQDGDIGISFIEMVPAPCVDVPNAFYNAMSQGDVDSVMALYRDDVFENMEGGDQGWRDYLTGFLDEVGEYQQHEISNWYTERVIMASGLEEDVVMVVTHVRYSNYTIADSLGVSYRDGVHDILYHSVEVVEE